MCVSEKERYSERERERDRERETERDRERQRETERDRERETERDRERERERERQRETEEKRGQSVLMNPLHHLAVSIDAFLQTYNSGIRQVRHCKKCKTGANPKPKQFSFSRE